jgi:hypothetical protein
VLVKQEYGEEGDWKQHFNYLLPFFKDDRYIKIDNKPVFVIYRDFKEKKSMCSFFNKSAVKNGFSGIFFVQSVHRKHWAFTNKNDIFGVNAVVIREPLASMLYANFLNVIIRKLYKVLKRRPNEVLVVDVNRKIKKTVDIANTVCKRLRKENIKCWLGVYSNWDNTSRHGIRGYKLTNISDEKYLWFLRELKKIADRESVNFLCFNAWNEWAESMILEPDIHNGYRFLEGIKQVFLEENKL